MFARARTELRWLIRDGIDAALEFATLGEYRLPAAEGTGTVPGSAHATFEGLPVRGAACPPPPGERPRARRDHAHGSGRPGSISRPVSPACYSVRASAGVSAER